MRARVFVLVLVLCAVWNASSQSQVKTRAERTNYIETSRYDDVVTFLNTVGTGSPLIHITTFGYTFEGRALPVAIVGPDPKRHAPSHSRFQKASRLHSGKHSRRRSRRQGSGADPGAGNCVRQTCAMAGLDDLANCTDLQRRWERARITDESRSTERTNRGDGNSCQCAGA